MLAVRKAELYVMVIFVADVVEYVVAFTPPNARYAIPDAKAVRFDSNPEAPTPVTRPVLSAG